MAKAQVTNPERALSANELAIDTPWAFARYESVRKRLPGAAFPKHSKSISNLLEVAEEFDTFLLDAFGVLNVGASAIPGAVNAIAALAQQGKNLYVLTNGATSPRADAVAKYRHLGFDFAPEQVISSRDLLSTAMAAFGESMSWGFAAPPHAGVDSLAAHTRYLNEDDAAFKAVDGFVLLSTNGWSAHNQRTLVAALKQRARPVLVGNPDIVAPHELAFSIEPGHFAHALADATGITPKFYGKPFANAFDEALARITSSTGRTPDLARTAMVGDTLHTDILGGAAAGLRTILVSSHGLFRGLDVEPFISRSGIVPNYIAYTT
jgi:glycerol 3-phosphatase-2